MRLSVVSDEYEKLTGVRRACPHSSLSCASASGSTSPSTTTICSSFSRRAASSRTALACLCALSPTTSSAPASRRIRHTTDTPFPRCPSTATRCSTGTFQSSSQTTGTTTSSLDACSSPCPRPSPTYASQSRRRCTSNLKQRRRSRRRGVRSSEQSPTGSRDPAATTLISHGASFSRYAFCSTLTRRSCCSPAAAAASSAADRFASPECHLVVRRERQWQQLLTLRCC